MSPRMDANTDWSRRRVVPDAVMHAYPVLSLAAWRDTPNCSGLVRSDTLQNTSWLVFELWEVLKILTCAQVCRQLVEVLAGILRLHLKSGLVHALLLNKPQQERRQCEVPT